MSPYLTRSVLAAQQKLNAALQAQLAPCARATLDIKSTSKPRPYRIEKRPAINFTLHYKEVRTVKKFVPASKIGPAINFTLHLKSMRTVKRYLPAQEIKVQTSDKVLEGKQQIKAEKDL
jgi:hypothetical protein